MLAVWRVTLTSFTLFLQLPSLLNELFISFIFRVFLQAVTAKYDNSLSFITSFQRYPSFCFLSFDSKSAIFFQKRIAK
jgi:hypothetical protein